MLKSKAFPTEKGATDTYEKILFAAIDLFSQDGYNGVSIRDITGNVGIKESSLYHYFSSKQEIIDTIYAFFKKMLSDEKTAATPGVFKPAETYIRLQSHLITFKKIFDKPLMRKMYRIVSMERYRDKQAFEIMQYDIYRATEIMHEDTFRKMIQAGIIKPLLDPTILAREYTYTILGMFGDYNIMKYYERSTTEIEDIMFEYVRFFWERVKNI